MKIWEVHAMNSDGRIRTTAEGHCEIDGMLLSERAYLLAIRDMRPAQLFALIDDLGPQNAASELMNYYASPEPGHLGRALVKGRSRLGDPILLRSDEVRLPAREFAT
ncbi:MAG: hypothetical protein ABI577_15405 [bacterium]